MWVFRSDKKAKRPLSGAIPPTQFATFHFLFNFMFHKNLILKVKICKLYFHSVIYVFIPRNFIFPKSLENFLFFFHKKLNERLLDDGVEFEDEVPRQIYRDILWTIFRDSTFS